MEQGSPPDSSAFDEDAVERWFVHRGVPHLIQDYSATEDIFTRAFPFLTGVMFIELFLSFTSDLSGWSQAFWFLAGLGFFVGALLLVNRLRGRSLLSLPEHVGVLELAVFVLAPPLLRMFSTGDNSDFWLWSGINAGILAVTYIVTSYGLFPMIPWALRQMISQIGGILQLFTKSLPLLLLFSAFLFVNAEIWQVASDIPDSFYAIVIGFLVVVGSLFVGVSLRHTLDDLNTFSSWDEVCDLCVDTPVEGMVRPRGLVEPPPLSRGARANLGLLVFVAQAIQILLVALMVAGFYVIFGLLTVRDATILQWTTSDEISELARFTLLGDGMVLSKELVYVAGFIAAFSGLQFAVSIITDGTYQREFTNDMAADVRQALAARCRYLAADTAPEAP